ncbi:MAG: hypothetical protein H7A23_03105 [Leptospiraceae bacterium]|nr:hypothetical protein [Leptospiraceae bacterium]MCP5493518.1 hypothetical protein [Leptospiraceae bacterium]
MFGLFKNGILILLCLFSQGLFADRCYSFIDLSRGNVELESNWRFAKGDNPNWKNSTYEDGDWAIKKMPDIAVNQGTKVSGYYWYRCRIYLRDKMKFSQHSVALNLGSYNGSTEIYLNDKLLTPPIDLRKQSDNKQAPQAFPIPMHFFQPGVNVLALRVYFHTNTSGFQIVPALQDESNFLFQNISPKAMVVLSGIIILTIGIYFITDCFLKPFNLEILFFVLFCIFFSFYELMSSDIFSFKNPLSTQKYALLLYIVLPVLFINFLIVYLSYKRRLYTYAYEIIILLFFVGILFLKTPYHFNLAEKLNTRLLVFPFFVSVSLIVYRAKKNLMYTKYILIGLLTLLPFFILDIFLFFKGIDYHSTTALFGSVFFLFFTSVQLNSNFLNKSQVSTIQKKETLQQDALQEGFILGLESITKKHIDSMGNLIENSINQTPDTKTLAQINNDINSLESIILCGKALWDIEHKSMSIDPEKFLLKEFVDEVIQDVENNLQEKRKNKEVVILSSSLEVTNSKLLFYLLLYHIIENAYLYSGKQSRIQISAAIEGNMLTIAVSDEGYGIPKQSQESIFQKFVSIIPEGSQLNNPRPGIGLTLVNKIVSLLKGKLDLFSQPGFGTKITITIPT